MSELRVGQTARESDIVQGVYSIKLPSNVRGKSAWKVWTPKLLVLKPQSTNGVAIHQSRLLLLTIFKSLKSTRDESLGRFILQEQLIPSRTIIFRCNSRKKPHAFTIYGEGRPLVHISGDSETESQSLMKSIRNLLWPPNPFYSLSKTLGSAFEISIIDNERSYRAGLLGVCGYLTVTSKKLILTCPQTGHVIQEWYMSTVSFKLVPQKNPKDHNKVVSMITNHESCTGSGIILIYCEEASELIAQVHKVRLMHQKEKGYGDELTEQLSTPPAEYDLMSHFDDYEHYQTPRNVSESSTGSTDHRYQGHMGNFPFDRSIDDPLSSSLSLSLPSSSWPGTQNLAFNYDFPRRQSYGQISQPISSSMNQPSILTKMPNISSSVLDCSLNSNQRSEYQQSSSYRRSISSPVETLEEEYHIYEEIPDYDDNYDEDDDNSDDDDGTYAVIKPLSPSKPPRTYAYEERENIPPAKPSEDSNCNEKVKSIEIWVPKPVPRKFQRNTIDIPEAREREKLLEKIGTIEGKTGGNQSDGQKVKIFTGKNSTKQNIQLKSDSIDKPNHFKLRRALSESWTQVP